MADMGSHLTDMGSHLTDALLSCSEGRLMAKDVLRMAPVPGMPRCLYQAPEWHLKALCNNLGVGLRCEKTDGSVWDGAPGKAINITVQFVGSTYTLLDG